MMKKGLFSNQFLWTVLVVFGIMSAVGVQAVDIKGSITGTVTDKDSAVIAGAEITMLNLDTGYHQTITTHENGKFRARLLPLGPYQVTVFSTGMAVYQREGITLTLGDVVTLNVQLQPITFEETITVSAEAPIVEVSNVDSGSKVNEKALATLPLNGRRFEDHLLLTAGAVADDYHIKINGQRGVNNNLMMDGADNNSGFFSEQRGGTRPPYTFSQEAVKEFEVLSNAYSAEFGRAGGAILNAVTKSGTNTYRGSLFYYYRDDSMVEKNALGWDYPDFEQHQFGGTLGGPIIKDKLFFFVAYDGQLKEQPIFANVDEYFSPEGDESGHSWFDDDPENAAKYDFWGNYGHDYIQTHDMNVLLTKIDWIVNSNHHVTLRNNYSRYISENGTTTSGVEAYNGYERTYSSSWVVSLTSLINENMYNEARFQYAHEDRPREPNDDTYPETRIRGRYSLYYGQKTYLPSIVDETRYQLTDAFTWIMNEHEMKFGFDLNKLEIDNTFLRYGGGSYEFSDISDFPDSPATYIQAWDRTGADGTVPMDTYDYALYVQDDWQPNDQFTFNFGLRYDYQIHPNPDMPNPNCRILPPGIEADDPGAEDHYYNPTETIVEDDDNIGPRLAMAWSPFSDAKTVVRAGWGIFYSRTPTILVAQAMSNNGYRLVTMSFYPSHPDFPDYPNRIPDLPAEEDIVPDIYVFAPDFENPETNRASLAIEHEVLEDFSVTLEYIYAHTTNLERQFDINLKPPEYDEGNGRMMYSRVKRSSDFGKILQFTSDGESKYHAVTVKFNKRFSHNYQFMGSYTWSQSKDNNSNEASTNLYGYDYPENMYDLDAEWGFSSYDIEHNFVASGTYEFDELLKLPEWFSLSMSGIFNWRSGKPWSAEANGDVNRDGYSNNDRPTYWDEDSQSWVHLDRNTYRHPAYKNFDMRLTTGFNFGDIKTELLLEAFNVFNWDNWSVGYDNMDFNEANPPGQDFGKEDYPGRARQYQVGLRVKF